MVAYQVTLQINTQDIGVREEICSIGAIDSDFASAESCIAVLQFLCNVYVLGEVSCVNVDDIKLISNGITYLIQEV